jgi:hypothetical protein
MLSSAPHHSPHFPSRHKTINDHLLKYYGYEGGQRRQTEFLLEDWNSNPASCADPFQKSLRLHPVKGNSLEPPN